MKDSKFWIEYANDVWATRSETLAQHGRNISIEEFFEMLEAKKRSAICTAFIKRRKT